jgi:hypothetical protein
LKVIYEIVFIRNTLTKTQILRFNEIISNYPYLIRPSEISKINLPSSFIAFSIKEIHDYFNLKNSENGLEYYKWKLKLNQLKILQREGDKWAKYID